MTVWKTTPLMHSERGQELNNGYLGDGRAGGGGGYRDGTGEQQGWNRRARRTAA